LEHPTALFYHGISKYEQREWEEAIIEFDKALKIYPNFSDAKYYKDLLKIRKQKNVSILYKEAKEDAKKGQLMKITRCMKHIHIKKMDKLEIKKRQVTAVLS
jgi:tetratricopeptide (TPR) repeat protein